VALFAATSYAARVASGKPDPNTIYKYSFFVGGVIQYSIFLVIVLAISGFSRDLLAWRRPASWPRAAGLAAAVAFALLVVIRLLELVLNAGEEQGLVPDKWDSSKAGAYALSFVAVAVVAPVVEELTYRGLGYSLLEPFGRWAAILVTGALFAASHGLVEGFPELMLFGCALAWLRSRTGSVFPGMAVHAVFNATALILVVLFA
jgi:membrane protease YdiL (CAAX protease family)